MKKYITEDSIILCDEYVDSMESIFETLSSDEVKQFTDDLAKSNKVQKKLINQRRKEVSKLLKNEQR